MTREPTRTRTDTRNTAAARDAVPPACDIAASAPSPSPPDEFLLDWIAGCIGGTERRQVVVVACGRAAPDAATDIDDQAGQLAGLRRQIATIVQRHGGTAAGVGGEVLIACWGWPETSDDDLQRALRAAHDIAATLGTTAGARCGVDVGITITWREDAATFGTGIVGEVVRTATTLQAAAEPGEVIIGTTAAFLTDCSSTMQPLPAHRLAGLPTPGWIMTREPAPPCARPPPGNSIVGRDGQIAAMMAAWNDVRRHACGAVMLLHGPAGSGKSVLAAHLRDRISAKGGVWAAASLGACETDPGLLVLNRAMGTLASDLALAATGRLTRLGPVAALQAVADHLARRTDTPTCALIIEDLHVADTDMLNVIFQVARIVRATPGLLLLATSRQPLPQLTDFDRAPATWLALPPMEPVDMARLIANVDVGHALTSTTTSRLIALAEGNPLRARDLTDLALTEPASQTGFRLLSRANRINPALSASLDGLGALKPLAQLASIASGNIHTRDLAEVIKADVRSLTRLLDALVLRGTLVETPTAGGQTSYRFRSELDWSLAYGSMVKSKRREMHARLAKVMEQAVRAGEANCPASVAHHYAKAGDSARAFTWWHRAAFEASRRGDPAAIIDSARHALAARLEAPDTCPAEQEAELLSLLGTYLGAMKGTASSEAVAIYRRAVGLMSELSVPPVGLGFDIGWGVAAIHLVHGDIQQALVTSQHLIQIADETVLPIALRQQATARLQAGQIREAIETFSRAAALYDPTLHDTLRHRYGSDPVAACLAHLAHAKAIAGDVAGSVAAERKALRMIASLDHPSTTANVLGVLATAAQSRHDRAATAALTHAAGTVAKAHGYENWAARAMMMQGWLLARSDPKAGIGCVRQGLENYRRTGAGRAIVLAATIIAGIAVDAGLPDIALQTLASVTGGPELQREWLHAAEVQRLQALALYRAGRIGAKEAASRLIDAHRLALAQGALTFAERADRTLTEIRPRASLPAPADTST